MTALAVMVALVGAMFVAMGSVSAADLGDCSTTATNVLGLEDTCDIDTSGANATVSQSNTTIDAGNNDISPVTVSGTRVTGNAYGAETVTVKVPDDAGTANVNEATERVYSFVVNKIAVTKVEFGVFDDNGTTEDRSDDMFTVDNDNVFAAGTDIDLRITVSYSEGDTPMVTVSAPTTGLSIATTDGTTQRLASVNADASRNDNAATTAADDKLVTVTVMGAHTLVTDGAPEGEYEVTATAANDDVTSSKFSAKLRIGDAGNVVADATLELGLMEGPSDGDATNDQPETGSVGRTGNVNLVLSVTNGIGNPARAADVDEIRVVAPFGDVTYYDGSGPEPVAADPKAMASKLMKGSLVINVASSGGKARTIDAYAIVLGKVGVATTGTVSLNFTGDAASVDLADATENLRSINLEDEMDSIRLMVTAADSSGNTAAVPDPLTITVHDPDGKQLATSGDSRKIDAERMTESGKTVIKVTNRSGNDADTALKVGEYTVKVTSGSIDDSAMFMVVGGADELNIVADNLAPSEIAERVVVTATVRSGDQPVADGTVVTFMSRDTTGDSDSVLVPTMSETPGTKDGVATATYVVIGAGSAVVTATADGQVGVVVVESTAGMVEPEAMPEEEVGVGCLSNLSGFSTWSCGVESSASEIFGLVSARGVTAIHLHNGTAWVRYSVVDGAMVPGSSDFMVTENDILYISN